MKFKFYFQHEQKDCGAACLRMICKHYGKHYSAQTLRDVTKVGKEGVSLLGIKEAAEGLGFKALGVRMTINKLLTNVPLPCILHLGQSHFVILLSIVDNSQSLLGFFERLWDKILAFITQGHFSYAQSTRYPKIWIADPARGVRKIDFLELEENWIIQKEGDSKKGLALLLEPTDSFYSAVDELETSLNFQYIFNLLISYKTLFFQLMIGTLLTSVVSILLPVLTQSIVDIGIQNQNISFINLMLIGQLILICSQSSINFLRSWILLHIGTRINISILSEFLSKIMRLPIVFFDVKQFGDIMQRISDHKRIEMFLTGQTIGFFFSVINLFFFGIILLTYSKLIFIIALVGSILYCIWAVLLLDKRGKIDSGRFEVSSANQNLMVQMIHGMQEIRLSGAEAVKKLEWERLQVKVFYWTIRSLSLSQVQQAGSVLINHSKNILITYIAAKLVINGDITFGALVAIQYIIGQINAPFEEAIGISQAWQDAKLSMERLNDIHKMEDEEHSISDSSLMWQHYTEIRLNNVQFTYPGAGNSPSLKNINLTIPRGKTTAIVGASGSGKTTLLKLLLRFYNIDAGTIDLKFEGGTDIIGLETISHKAWRMSIGSVLQDGYIFSDTIARNIALADEDVDLTVLDNACSVANISGYISSLPMGHQTIIGTQGKGLSQGQKQRILIARAVYKDPSLLLFDEATNALDANNEATIVNNLSSFNQGRTVVIVAHRLSTVKNADQIVVLDNGEIAEVGTHLSLIAAKDKYWQLISNQLELSEA